MEFRLATLQCGLRVIRAGTADFRYKVVGKVGCRLNRVSGFRNEHVTAVALQVFAIDAFDGTFSRPVEPNAPAKTQSVLGEPDLIEIGQTAVHHEYDAVHAGAL